MRLDRMEKLTALVSTMRTADISEIRSFATPPKAILYILRQLYLLLGEPTKSVKAWINVSKLLGQKGKRAIQKRIQSFRVTQLSPKRAAEVEAKVQKFGQSVEEIATINKSVSLLFAWMQGVLDIVRSVDIVNGVSL